ncbi:MAG TPA: hypothetical protein VFV41_14850 [Streptosporangiaceae bacterium]|nr:hypothetical protein [Streptosporangiaceae bacterium]
MLRLTLALLVRMGLVLLVMAVLVRLLPMPSRADAVADDFAIAVSLVVVLGPAIYLRLTRNTRGS